LIHSLSDAALAEHLHGVLINLGANVVSYYYTPHAVEVPTKLIESFHSSDLVVAILTKNSVHSADFITEVALAYAVAQQKGRPLIVGVTTEKPDTLPLLMQQTLILPADESTELISSLQAI